MMWQILKAAVLQEGLVQAVCRHLQSEAALCNEVRGWWFKSAATWGLRGFVESETSGKTSWVSGGLPGTCRGQYSL